MIDKVKKGFIMPGKTVRPKLRIHQKCNFILKCGHGNESYSNMNFDNNICQVVLEGYISILPLQSSNNIPFEL